jgi:hypothetical protein
MKTCDYCGGDNAVNLTDLGDLICDPCLIGRPSMERKHTVTTPYAHTVTHVAHGGSSGPIVITRTHTGELYANVNGVARGSVTCYFSESGELISHTLYGDKLVPKLHAVIAARGLVIPGGVIDKAP